MGALTGQLLTAGIAASITVSCVLIWLSRGGKLFELTPQRNQYRSSLIFLTLAGLSGAVVVWSILSALRPTGVTRIPSLSAVLVAFYEMLIDGSLKSNFLISSGRIIIGFGLACVVGIVIGWISGTFLLPNRLLLPTGSFLRYIPPTAFVTLLIVYFGIDESYKYAVVFVSVFFFVIQMTVDAVEDIDHRYFEMARLSGLPPTSILTRVVVPATMPRIIDIIRINLSGAWTFLVAAEVVGADGGIGHMIAISQRFGRIEQLYVAICVFGIIGLASDYLIRQIGRRAFRWQS